MSNNITADDRNAVIKFLKTDPILTNGPKVREFEEVWSKWLGVKYSVFVNSGASANLLTMAYWKYSFRPGNEIIVPSLTWVSDISSVIQNGFKPRFVDVDKHTLGMSLVGVDKKINADTSAIFLTHVMGLPAKLPGFKKQMLIEDCCEAHGATIYGRKVGTYGVISNFSFYFAHHMSTIEGGMVCTDDEGAYESIRMMRSHGMVREMNNQVWKDIWNENNPRLHPNFIFALPAYNMRSTEINAVIGLNQIKRLDENIEKRKENFEIFLNELSGSIFETDLAREGASPYALILIQKNPDLEIRDKIESLMSACNVEFRRGLSGGGNQTRQPYINDYAVIEKEDFPYADHITDFSWYIGNYPDLEHSKIRDLCKLLNQF